MNLKEKFQTASGVVVVQVNDLETMQLVCDELENIGFTETSAKHPQLKKGAETANFYSGKSGNKVVLANCSQETIEFVEAVVNGGAK